MIQINHISAIIEKDFRVTLRNMQILILFIIYPVVGFVMSQSAGIEKSFYISVFATMHFVFTPIVSTSAMISEEKDKNTLRVLRMSGITSAEFFLSTALFVLILDCLTGSSLLLLSGQNGPNPWLFYSAGILGGIISILVGLCIGTFSRSTSAASGLAVAVGMVLAFIPMLSFFNKGLEKFSKFLYGQQVKYLIEGKNWSAESIAVILINLGLIVSVYVLLYKRSKLDE